MAREPLHSSIWYEEAEPDDPFAARAAYCRGFDVYGEMLSAASIADYLFLLFAGSAPTPAQARTLEALGVALGNPGPREVSVQAAMNAGVSGSPAAACLMAALAVGAGQYGGAREVFHAVAAWERNGTDVEAWRRFAAGGPPAEDRPDLWPASEHPPGFNPHGVTCPMPVRQMLALLADISPGPRSRWLHAHRRELEAAAGLPLAMPGVAAAALADLGLEPDHAEMLYLLLRLPGAAAHALEQRSAGWRRFPFYGDALVVTDDPASDVVPPAMTRSPEVPSARGERTT